MSVAVVLFFVACALGAVAGTMDWLLFIDSGSTSRGMTRIGAACLVLSHTLLVGTLVLHARLHWTWTLGLLGAAVSGVVLGLPAAFMLGLLDTSLYDGHWSFG